MRSSVLRARTSIRGRVFARIAGARQRRPAERVAGMRKHMGMFDTDLLAAIDECAERETGGNRRLWVEKACRAMMVSGHELGCICPCDVMRFDVDCPAHPGG